MAAPKRLADVAAALDWLRACAARAAQLQTDSRRVAPGDVFIAWPGYAQDGRAFVGAALAAGASACLVEAEAVEAFGFDDDRIAALPGLKAATGAIADAWYGAPSARLSLVASTGTNGKTSTAWWMAQALSLAGRRCGVIGTLGVGEPPTRLRPQAQVQATGLTTPDPITLHRSLRAFEQAGFAACALEASSIGVVEQRLAAARIEVALFTNFTPDHLDYHGSMQAYWAAKRALFDWPGLRAAVVNLDDAQGAALAAELQREGRLDLWSYSRQDGTPARLRAEALHYEAGGLAFTLLETRADGSVERAELGSRLIGAYNVSNLLAVLGGLRALGLPLGQAAALAAEFTPVPGRMDRVPEPVADAVRPAVALPQVVVDYAHTPDALDQALQALRPFAQARGGRLWAVFGCGGNRDAGKRPVMGRIASERADEVIVTSDNPRLEPPEAIVAQVAAGAQGPARLRCIVDRGEAIARALAEAAPADVLLLAGKGHEDYQDVGGVKRPFLDAAVAGQALQRRAAQATLPALGELHRLLAARRPQAQCVGDATVAPLRVHSDTRSLQPGDLFVALRGERFDAADFLPQARHAGAVAALAERGLAEAGLSGLALPDALDGLQQLALAWRASLTLPLIGVTGSNGKTTVTQMIASILRTWCGATAHATAGNLNNHIGVPLTVLGLRANHRAAVIELGMNHPGEIAVLAAIAQPTVALVNNAQREHQEFMKTVEAVARENGAAITALPADGTAVFPADDAYTPLWRALAGSRRVLTFALDDAAADLRAEAAWAGDHWAVRLHSPAGDAALRLAVAGRHNVKNALAAAACALAAGCPLDDIVRGLQAFTPVKGRSQVELLRAPGGDLTLVDDSYNANPDSVRAAIEVLAELPAPRWLLLGDMGEVGDEGPAFHAEVGALAAQRGLEVLWCAGSLAQHAAAACAAAGGPTAVRHFADTAALLRALPEAPAARSVLVKGSRFMKMEQVVAALRMRGADAPPTGAAHAG
ncbi:MAG: bifunctional UDP-N-acetylmuramoyl-L-alanyl-D-glutamate--2,6-diaminopimelate ligase MurE/UDP-N-acetylmuramoyl-tripeptide--D-alanyl-D-alanine ligase MurF [Burkholderiaceae bacterium]|nr:bifunctional UDP-N-acetylmuramoyl-L-alanyl-D-glutamate--2,6-diaminopimelate ligase MurE/UDP-N-acetylmuramoyl-tripeptide--D-alanyl-D-alanine ligase MurF [Burkholderiaceae bacterium]